MHFSSAVIHVHLCVGMSFRAVNLLLVLFFPASTSPVLAADAADSARDNGPKLIAPAVSLGTGLLLEPALTLPEFTREKFVAAMNTVGPETIHKPWTNPVVTLPPHSRADVKA
jgi:hypothetical protein